MENLNIVKNVSWNFVASAITQLINIFTGIFLARLLTPLDFGLVSIILLFTGFLTIFSDLGFSMAIIQKKEVDENHFHSVFWANLFLSCVCALFLFLSANLIANFYEDTRLIKIVYLSSLLFIVTSLSSIHGALLKKKLMYREIALSAIFANVLSSCLGVYLAYTGNSYWAILYRTFYLQLSITVCYWYYSGYIPKLKISILKLKELANFSINYTFSQSYLYWIVKADEILIGKFLGKESLGIYSNAYRLFLMPINLIKNQTIDVLFPSFSLIQDDKQKVKELSLNLSATLAFFSFPLIFLVLLNAKELIIILIGYKWIAAYPILCILTTASLFEVTIFPSSICLSQGRADIYRKLMFFTKGLSFIGMLIGLQYGLIGLSLGILCAAICSFLPYIYISGKLINLKIKEILQVNFLPFIISLSTFLMLKIFTIKFYNYNMVLNVFRNSFLFIGLISVFYYLFKPKPLNQILFEIKKKYEKDNKSIDSGI